MYKTDPPLGPSHATAYLSPIFYSYIQKYISLFRYNI